MKKLAALFTLAVLTTLISSAAYAQAGLVSYWPADGSANDVVGGNNGTLLNGAGYRPGVFGQSFSFDGVDDLLQAPTVGLPTGNSDRTLSMWVKVDAYVTVESFFGAYGNFGSGTQVYYIGASGSNLFITQWGTGAGATGGGGGPPVPPGEWHHVAATNVGNFLSLFLDGNLVATASVPVNTAAGTQFYSGRIPGVHGDIRRLQGAVDEMAVFNRALSGAEIQTIFTGGITPPTTPTTGLVSYWPADGNANDVTGPNNGTLRNSAAFGPGFAGQAFSLDGSGGYIEVPDSPSLSVTGHLTLSAYIKINTNGPQQAIIEKYDVPGRNGYLLRLLGGKLLADICDPNTCSQPPAAGATTVSTGTWHHVAAVFDGTSVKVYLDGILDGSVATNFVLTDGAASLKIGARGDDANTRLGGLIDEVKIYNRALSASEIQTLSAPPPSQSRAYVTHQGTTDVKVVDLATNVVVGAIPLGVVPNEIAVTMDGTRAYVTTWNNRVSVINTALSTVVSTIPVGSGPFGIAVTPDGAKVYVTNNGSNTVSVINTAANAVSATVTVGANPVGVVFTPDGTRAYVTNITSGTVSVIDTASDSVTATLSLGSYAPYGIIQPWGINITPDGSRAVVTNVVNHSVTVIDTTTNAIVTNIGIAGGFNPRYVDFSPDGNLAYVSVEGGGNVSVIDMTTLTETASFHEGTSPFGLAVSLNGERAYIANYNSGFTVIDTATQTIIVNIPMAQGTFHVALWEIPPADSTPPVITSTITGTSGNNGWYAGDVAVIWSVTDEESSVSSSTGCDPSTVTVDTSGVVFTCSATSAGGTATQSVTIKRDMTAPSISCGTADGAWHGSDVAIACAAGDDTSGLANGSDAGFVLSTDVAAGTETSNAATYIRQVCDAAGNCSTADSVVGNMIDKKAPTISITSPTAGNYLLNQAMSVAFSCSDGGSGVADCIGSTANGGALDTGSVGPKTFTLNSTDNVGNSAAPIVVNYTVGYGLVVLFDQTRAHKSGSTVPIKVRLVDANGANVSSASIVLRAISVIQISTQASTTLEDSGESNPDLDFRYDASLDGYVFNLKTTGYTTGSYLLSFVAGAATTPYSVGFQIRQ